jgi:flavin reductase (DIM6/NTAB) family NADH-FMN oxidoreductase RutF
MSLHVADRPLFDTPDRLAGDFRAAMRRLGATVAIITGADRGRTGGLTATAVCSVCIDPPSLLICVNQSSNTHGLIAGSRRFGVNFLERGQRDVAETFAGRTGHDGKDKFAGAGTWLDDGADLPMLEGAVAFVACRVIREVVVDTHTVFVGLVERVASKTDGQPLLYADQQFAVLSE